MNVIPRSAIRLLELQSVPLTQVGIESVTPATHSEKKSSGGFLSNLKKGFKTKEKVEVLHHTRKQHFSFNMAAWLRFGLSDESRLATLCLAYTDAKGEHVVLVEEKSVEDKTSAMLSSFVEIETKGPLLGLKVCCAGLKAEDRCYIEDLSIKRADLQAKAAV